MRGIRRACVLGRAGAIASRSQSLGAHARRMAQGNGEAVRPQGGAAQ